MGDQMIFRRYEYKYLLSRWQQEQILLTMESHMEPDAYSHSSIRSLYCDTPDFRLIRTSLMQPTYKEKLRLRSYGSASESTPIFVELKKKYHSVVYKRRICVPRLQAENWLAGNSLLPDSQISREIDWAMQCYPSLHPALFLSYERDAYRERGGGSFRVTFDDSVRYRSRDLSLGSGDWGTGLLAPDTVLMELKLEGSMPLWMAHALSENRIFKTSFSKCGTAYCRMLESNLKGTQQYA